MFDDPTLLSNEKIREELSKEGIAPEFIDSIVEQFWFHDWGNSFIAEPERFSYLKKYLSDVKPHRFLRYDFYSFYFAKSIPEFPKYRTFFHKIALVYELMQTDKLPLTEFVELLKRIDAPNELTTYLQRANFLSIVEEQGIEHAKVSHHTLTEFLAAEYIIAQKEAQKAALKFMISSIIPPSTFIPSWTGTLRFLLEQSPEAFVDWLLNIAEDNENSFNDHLAETLIFSTSDTITSEYKAKVFRVIYDFYQKKKWWMPVWVYHHLYKFIDEDIYQDIKKSESATTENDFIFRGNVAAIVDGMLKHHHPLAIQENMYWRAKLIEYANDKNENRVIRRHALAALSNYKGDKKIITKVQANADDNDSLVREAFISMCKEIDANALESIHFFVEGIADDRTHIYARNALYDVNSKQGVDELLKRIAANSAFIHEFLDKESIFNGKDRYADSVLIENIRKNVDSKNIALLKILILKAFTGGKNYQAGKSYFLQQLARIVQSVLSSYLEELIMTIKELPSEEQNNVFVNDIEGIIAVLLRPDDLANLQKTLSKEFHNHAEYTLAEAVRLSLRVGNPQGEEIIRKGIELGIIIDPAKFEKFDNSQERREGEIYKQFQDYLSPPTSGQYFPQVFKYFVDNQSIIEAHWTKEERVRLLRLATESNLNKIAPEKIQVHYKDKETKSGQYTISSFASYFGDVLQVIYLLDPSVLQTAQNRQKIINFIPFAYSNNWKIIQESLGQVFDDEITTLNRLMMDKENDARYLLPGTYVYFADIFSNLKTTKEVLFSIIQDPLIPESDRQYAIKSLKKHLIATNAEDEKFLISLWNPSIRNQLSDNTNSILISVYHNTQAIKWRFDVLKSFAKPFVRKEGFHSLGNLEEEFDSMSFAKPLIELGDEKYLPLFIDLLNYSLNFIEKTDYWEYVQYVWKVAIAFVIRDDLLLSQSALDILKKWGKGNIKAPKINWFNKSLEMTVSEQLFALTRIRNMKDALKVIEK